MSQQSSLRLVQRLESLWHMHNRARECLTYVDTISRVAHNHGNVFDDHPILGTLYWSSAVMALMLTAHLTDKDESSLSVCRTVIYAKNNLGEFALYHEANPSKSTRERNQALQKILADWHKKFESVNVANDIKTVRDWTLAHTDLRSITRPHDVPVIQIVEVRWLLDRVNEFVNDLLSKIEDRTLEAGKAILEQDIRNEVFDVVARLAVVSNVFDEEMGQGGGPALRSYNGLLDGLQ